MLDNPLHCGVCIDQIASRQQTVSAANCPDGESVVANRPRSFPSARKMETGRRAIGHGRVL